MQHSTSVMLQKFIEATELLKKLWNEYTNKFPFPSLTIDWCLESGLVVHQCNDPEYEHAVSQFINVWWKEELYGRIYPELKRVDDKSFLSSEKHRLKRESALTHIDRIVYADVSRTAHLLKIGRDGIHEMTVSPDQAAGLIGMKFNLSTEDFLMPVDSMIIHFPKDIWNHPIFQSQVNSCVEETNSIKEEYTMLPDDAKQMDKKSNEFIKNKSDISVLVQKHNTKNQTVTAFLSIPNYASFTVYATKDIPFEKAIGFSGGFSLFFRAALSAVLVSSIKPDLVENRTISGSIQKERKFLLQKIEKTIPTKKFVAAYSIFQSGMKTYADRTTASGTGKSPSEIIIKPVFVWGHWRRQPYGPRREQRRIQWIKSYIRNKDLLLVKDPQIITTSQFTQPEQVIDMEVKCSQQA